MIVLGGLRLAAQFANNRVALGEQWAVLLGKLNTVYHKTPDQVRQASNGPVGYIVQ